MLDVLYTIIWCFLRRLIHGPATEFDVATLRHQVATLRRQLPDRPKLDIVGPPILFGYLQVNPRSLVNMLIVKPDTVIRWHRAGFRLFWKIKSGRVVGRPKVPAEARNLIQEMSIDNPHWGAPRIHGELLKLGIDVSKSTVAKYIMKGCCPPSQGWRTFLRNHADGIAAIDLFVVPTLGIKLLFGVVILDHDRRKIVHMNATYHPTAEWIARQVVEAF